MKKKIVYIILAFLFAFAGSLGFYFFQTKVFKPIIVYETKRIIMKGEMIKKDDLTEKTIYGGNAENDVVIKANDIIGKYAKLDFAEGDRLRYSKIADKYNPNDIYKELLKPGESAIAVNTNLRQAVGGIPEAGDFVNVIAINNNSTAQEKNKAKTILQHVEVLAIINKQADSISKNNKINEKNSTYMQGYEDRSPAVTVLKIHTQNEALLALYSEVVLSLNSNDYKPYKSEVIKNEFSNNSYIPSEAKGGEF